MAKCTIVAAVGLVSAALVTQTVAVAEVVSPASAATEVASSGVNGGKTLGFVVKDWMPAVYETKFMDECPAGLNISNDEIWWRDLTKQQRSELTQDGLITTLDRWFTARSRGPNGEDICINPHLITDDPPLLTVEGPTAFGINLDGNVDGNCDTKHLCTRKFCKPRRCSRGRQSIVSAYRLYLRLPRTGRD